jgi:hypothetical protein
MRMDALEGKEEDAMHRRSLVLALMLVAVSALGIVSSSALAALSVNESFEYDSPGLTFEGQHVGPAHCIAKYQVAPSFPAKIEEGIIAPGGFPGGGREIVRCKSTNKKALETNVPAGHAFPELNPAANYWVSEWFRSFTPGQTCFTITLPRDRVHGHMGARQASYVVIAYLEYTRECHPRA